ncbi:MAG: F0F1 ATP synthase subunit A [Thermodesulfobacteriota bacterium]|jgi:F-type H+-transporting ATPase subunit a|nr:MAG: F0F1 ATP synthase subunit A [Thermodesulfobacteriota bacterium]
MEHGFTWFSLLPFISDDPERQLVFTTIFIAAVLFVISAKIFNSIKKSPNPLIPQKKFSFQNFFELVIQVTVNLMKDIIGPHSEKYLPLIGSLFIFILFCNLLGLIPGFLPPTSNLYTNAACAIIVFLYYNYQGFKEHGIKYLKQFAGPLIYLAPLMFVIEIISHIFRPFSLMVRLYGNISGDHAVLAIFSGLVPLVVPVVFLVLGLMVALIQAFVFATLSTVYIGLAVSHEH